MIKHTKIFVNLTEVLRVANQDVSALDVNPPNISTYSLGVNRKDVSYGKYYHQEDRENKLSLRSSQLNDLLSSWYQKLTSSREITGKTGYDPVVLNPYWDQ